MKITSQSELMKNHKHAEVMAPDAVFRAAQTSEGHALLFSIGTDNVFYLVQETPTDVTGWVKTDLSSGLSEDKVTAKTFDVALNHATGLIDIALAVTIDGKDSLYLSLGNSNADATWTSNLTWNAMPSDDAGYPSVVIEDVFLSQGRSSEYIVVDVLKDPSNAQNFVFRFFVNPDKKLTGNIWNRHDLAADLQAGTISSLLGKRAKDRIDGVYTMGSINDKEELIFTPLYNIYDSNVPPSPPSPVRLVMPTLASAMSLTANTDGSTNLFVAGDKALYFFPSSAQKDGSTGQAVVNNAIFAGVQKMYSEVVNGTVYVWGLNQAGAIFYLKCAQGQETVSTAWSCPVPLLDGVEQMTPYANVKTGHAVIFAHLTGQNLIQLTQDPYTAIWQQRSILLPATDVNDVLEYNSFSTHIKVTDDNNAVLGKAITLSVTSKSPVGIYVENAYHKLSPDVPTDIDTDVTGVLTIIQETQALSAICYHVVQNDTGAVLDINPMSKVMDTVSKIQGSDDLDKVQLDNGDGTTKPLLPSDTSQDQKDATASALKQFSSISSTLPADGSKKVPAPKLTAAAAVKFVPQANNIWGISYKGDSWTYHEGQAAMDHFGLQVHPTTNRLVMTALGSSDQDNDFLNAIETAAEDIWNWLKKAWEDVTQFFVHLVDDIYHLVVEIAGEIYKFVVDCISVIVNAVEFVLNKIKVFFEDLIKWLGFLFGWDDILRTHAVLKNMFIQYANYCIANIETCKTEVNQLAANIKANVDSWAGLPDDTYGNLSSGSTDSGQNSPQSNWGTYHTKSNVSNSQPPPLPATPKFGSLLDSLKGMVETEGAIFSAAASQIQDLIDNISSLSLAEIFKRLIAIITDLLVETAANLFTEMLTVCELLIEGVIDTLNAPLNIPVISWLYGVITKGSVLSFLDLICLVVAIPVNIIYKLAKNEAPFPDDANTTALQNAKDFNTIMQLCVNPSPAPQLKAASAVQYIPNQINTNNVFDKLAFSGNICAGFGGCLIAIFGTLKLVYSDSKPIAIAAACSYMPYVAPDIFGNIPSLLDKKSKWYAGLNTALGIFGLLKAFVDISSFKDPNGEKIWSKVSPVLDYFSNLIWEIPAACYYLDSKRNTNDILGLTANTLFNASGILSPFIANTKPPAQVVFAVGSIVCNVGYGAMSAAISLDNLPTD